MMGEQAGGQELPTSIITDVVSLLHGLNPSLMREHMGDGQTVIAPSMSSVFYPLLPRPASESDASGFPIPGPDCSTGNEPTLARSRHGAGSGGYFAVCGCRRYGGRTELSRDITLSVGDVTGAYLRSLSADLPILSCRDADHRLHQRGKCRAENSGSHRRIDTAAEYRPGTRDPAVGGGNGLRTDGQRSTMGTVGAACTRGRIRSAHRLVTSDFPVALGTLVRLTQRAPDSRQNLAFSREGRARYRYFMGFQGEISALTGAQKPRILWVVRLNFLSLSFGH